EDGIRDFHVTGVQTCALPISSMGGLLAQRWLTTGRDAVAVVTIGSIPPSGMTGAILRMAWTQPRNLFEIAQVAGSGMASRRFMRSEERRVGKEWRCRRSTVVL